MLCDQESDLKLVFKVIRVQSGAVSGVVVMDLA